jgi:hypothetical protein
MKTSLAAAAALAVMALAPGHAQAQNYPWCAQYSMQGVSNCGFVTEQQCMAALSGNGGYCSPNPMFRPPAAQSLRR